MAFFYILCQDHKYPLWEYTIVEELSNRSCTVKHRLVKPAQIAITRSGLSYVTNQKDGVVVVFDSKSMSLKATHSLNSCSGLGMGSLLVSPTCISPDSSGPTCYIVPRVKPLESKKLCIVTPQENGKFISVSSANLDSTSPYTVCGGPEGHIYLGNAKEECIYTYNLSKGFVNTFNVDCTPTALAYDSVKKNIHVCDLYTNTIKVFSCDGSLRYIYGKHHLVMPQQLVIGSDGCSFVVCSFNVRSFLAVFDPSGTFLYSVHGFISPCGVGVGPDGAVWISDSKKHHLVKLEGLSQIKVPFPLPLLCYKTILLHLNDLDLTKLPTEYSKVLDHWNQPVNFTLREGTTPTKSICLKLKHGLSIDIVKWILCQRLQIPEKSLMVFRETEEGKHVQHIMYYMDHLVVDQLATPTTPPPLLDSQLSLNTSS